MPKLASLPPTILVSGLENRAGTPQVISLFSAAAGIVSTEPVLAGDVSIASDVDVPGSVVVGNVLDDDDTGGLDVVVVEVVVDVVDVVVDVVVVDVVVGIVVFFVGRGFVGLSRYEVVM